MAMFKHAQLILIFAITLVQFTTWAFTIENPTTVVKSIYFSSENPLQEDQKERKKLPGSKNLWIVSRTIPIFPTRSGKENCLNREDDQFMNGCIKVWELEKPSDLINAHWSISPSLGSNSRKDPFGVVMWPGSILASRQLAFHKSEIINQTVVVLGAGTGVEAQAAAYLGAKKVFALDVNKLTLKLASYGAQFANLDHIMECREFDVFSRESIPKCDIMVVADVLYNEELSAQIGRRCKEVLSRNPPTKLIVTDSQRFHGTDFLVELNKERENEGLEILQWEEQTLNSVTASGVVIEEDQTYDAKTRLLSVGWNT